jgi:hypothetical protein
MLSEEMTGRFHGGEITFCNLPIGIEGVPLELLLDIRNEVVRLAFLTGLQEAQKLSENSRSGFFATRHLKSCRR